MTTMINLPPYEEETDFSGLAKKDPDFGHLLEANKGHIDLHDPQALKQLTKSILKQDFNLRVELPDNRLCPPVPVRWNYVHWIQLLIDTTNPSYSENPDSKRLIVGLDIGTGASAVYPLLTLQTRPAWSMYATEIDPQNVGSAQQNIQLNSFNDRCTLIAHSDSNMLIPPLEKYGIDHLDFTICNPPFFASAGEMHSSLIGEGKRKKPSAVCTGAKVEMVTDGGDLGFVLRLVEDSLRLREQVSWYSSMFGKLSSCKSIIEKLKEVGINNYAVACLWAGGKTRRWAVAWSFGDLRPRNDVVRSGLLPGEILPFPTDYHIPLSTEQNPDKIAEKVNEHMESLEVRWMWKSTVHTGVGLAPQNVWSRAYRRQHKIKEATEVAAHEEADNSGLDGESDDEEKVALGFKIQIIRPGEGVSHSEVSVRWLRGTDQVLWESFCGMLKRTVDGVK